MEIPEAGHRAFRVYYVRDPGRLHGLGREGARGPRSALVTGRTLFCIELIGGDAKHVVALNAHAVKNGARDGRELGGALRSGRAGLGASGFGGHELILAREGLLANPRHPEPGREHLLLCGMSNILDEKCLLSSTRHRPFAPVVTLPPRVFGCVYVRHGGDRKPHGPSWNAVSWNLPGKGRAAS